MWAGDQKAAAVSLSTGIRNIAINSQVTRTWGVPGQRNFPTMIQGLFQNAGPYTDIRNYIGKEFPGYIKVNTHAVSVWRIGPSWEVCSHGRCAADG